MSLRNISILIALSGAPLLADLAIPTQAQAQVQYSKVRALNLARGTAIKINGGLSVYQPAPCMFSTSNGGEDCLIRNTSDGYTYRFLGGTPGWSQDGIEPTKETEIQISPDGKSVQQVIYNGSPR